MRESDIHRELMNVGGYCRERGVTFPRNGKDVAFAFFEGCQGVQNALRESRDKRVLVNGCCLSIEVSTHQDLLSEDDAERRVSQRAVAPRVDWDAAASDGSKGDGMHAGIFDVSAALASMPRSSYK
jgi:hypothetical protein